MFVSTPAVGRAPLAARATRPPVRPARLSAAPRLAGAPPRVGRPAPRPRAAAAAAAAAALGDEFDLPAGPLLAAAAAGSLDEDDDADGDAAAGRVVVLFDALSREAQRAMLARLGENDVEYNDMKHMCKDNGLGGKVGGGRVGGAGWAWLFITDDRVGRGS
jgi:hypothetical protein